LPPLPELVKRAAGLVAVVTGTSRGIGRDVARLLTSEGAHVLGCARTTPAEEDGFEQLSLDLADPGSPEALFDRAIDHCGRIDIWINNAGILTPVTQLQRASGHELATAISVNATAVAISSALFAAHVAGRDGGGVLINLSSGAATGIYEGWAHYCAAKAFVDSLTSVVALEEKRNGLRAYAVAPGMVDTDMQTLLRSTPEDQLPTRQRFVERFEAGELKTPEVAAAQLVELALGTQQPEEAVLRLR